MTGYIIAGIVLLVLLLAYLRYRSNKTLMRRIAEKEGNDIFANHGYRTRRRRW